VKDCKDGAGMKPSEVLDRAADIIIRDGWLQGHYYLEVDWEDCADDRAELDRKARESAPCCQAGAISRAAYGVAWRSAWRRLDERVSEAQKFAAAKAEGYMQQYVREVLGSRVSSIAWNDAPDTTAEDVIDALRGAAGLARASGE